MDCQVLLCRKWAIFTVMWPKNTSSFKRAEPSRPHTSLVSYSAPPSTPLGFAFDFLFISLFILSTSYLLDYNNQSPKYTKNSMICFYSRCRNWVVPPVYPGMMLCKHPLLLCVSLFLFWVTYCKNRSALTRESVNPPLLMIIEVLWGRAHNLR